MYSAIVFREAESDSSSPSIAVPGDNCWQRPHAGRAAFLVDGDAYFAAFVAAAERARHSIVIVGWDVHSRTRLPNGEELKNFLDRLAARRRSLRVYVLDWDFAVLYALEREVLPAIQFGWRSHKRVAFALDGLHPVGASQHQKLVVIDDAVAFAGGLDLTINRWDTPEHRAGDPRRVDPDGTPYTPFHDVQMVVDGDAAAALGSIVRRRWRDATGGHIRRPRGPLADVWPEWLRPDLRDVPVAIARTLPTYEGSAEVREVERLFLASIAAARRSIYIENQYLSAAAVVPALSARLQEADGPEVVLVSGKACSGWLEERTMGALRGAWLHQLRAADRHGRFRAFCPVVPAADGIETVNVHAKVMIVDDAIARVGSANLSNRSFGLDSECDLMVESEGDRERAAAIASFRNRLLGEHLAAAPEAVAAAIDRHDGSLIAAIEALRTSARRLDEIAVGERPPSEAVATAAVLADPEQPIEAEALAKLLLDPAEVRRRPHRPLLRVAAVLALPLLLAAAWQWTPLHGWLDRAALADPLRAVGQPPFGVLWVSLIYVAAGLLAVPVTLLIVATVFAYGSGLGIPYALAGALSSALVTYGVGRALGRAALARLLGARFVQLRRRLAGCGVAAMTLLRLVPIAPFSLVNVVAGAANVPLRSYTLGTLFGMAPGITALGLVTAGLTGETTAALIAGIGGVILLALLLLAGRLRGSTPR